jgi:hypothetical protein
MNEVICIHSKSMICTVEECPHWQPHSVGDCQETVKLLDGLCKNSKCVEV